MSPRKRPATGEGRTLVDKEREILDREGEILAPLEPAKYTVLRGLATKPANHFAVGFGGGALHGLAGNCALASLLEELGLKPHVREVWGTSAGAVVGAGWSGGLSGSDILEKVHIRERRPLDLAYWQVLVKVAFRYFRGKGLPEGLFPGRNFRAALKRGLPVPRIEDCEIPFRAIACTDDGHSRKVVFREGPLLEAVLASMAVPGIFFPVPDWNGQPHGYMDGGIVEKTPLLSIIADHVREGRKTKLFVLCTHFDSEGQFGPLRGFVDRLLSAVHSAEDDSWIHQLERARRVPGCTFATLNPRMEFGKMFEFEKLRSNYLWARRAFKEQLSNKEFVDNLAGH